MNIIAYLAWRDMARDRRIVMLVIFMLAFSYLNLTFFPAFLNGLSNTIQSEVIDTATSHILITPSSDATSPYLNFVSSTRKKIDLVPGVVGSSAHIQFAGTIVYNGKETAALIEAVTPSEDEHVTTIRDKVIKGTFLSDTDSGSVTLGELVAGQKIEDRIGQGTGGFGAVTEGLGGVEPGEIVRIDFANGKSREYRVKGITGTQGFSQVSQTVYITTDEAEEILGLEDQATSILIRLQDKNQADAIKRLILDLGLPSAKIQTWSEASSFAAGLNQTFGIVIVVATLVGIIIVTATIGIIIFINTSRKKRIIGVLKSIGMQRNQILAVFVLESIFFGAAGTLVGVGLMAGALFFFQSNPIILPLGVLVPVLAISDAINAVIILMLAALIAGYFPSRVASKQDVLDTIKVVE